MMRGIEEWNRHAVPAVRDASGAVTTPGHDPYGGTGEWSFRHNSAALKAYWTDGIRRMTDQGIEGVVTLGMRGNGDTSLGDGDGIELMDEIIGAQRTILSEVTGKDAAGLSAIPQVWTMYKEVQRYWDSGLRAPDDVTVVFTDDNWGNIRKVPDPATTAAQRRLRPVLPLRLRGRRPRLQVGGHHLAAEHVGPAAPDVRLRRAEPVGGQRRRPQGQRAAPRSSSSTTPGTPAAGSSPTSRSGNWRYAKENFGPEHAAAIAAGAAHLRPPAEPPQARTAQPADHRRPGQGPRPRPVRGGLRRPGDALLA